MNATSVWRALVASPGVVDSLLLWNSFALDCADHDSCLGVSSDGHCVCYQE